MRLTVTWKQFRMLQAAALIKHFHLETNGVVHAMMTLQCRDCRKEKIRVRVMTTWYKR